MTNKLNVGIDLVAHHLAEFSAGKSYLLSGERATGKTTFLLQFLFQGLKERQTCVLVSNQSPDSIVAHAENMGMDLHPFLKDGTLLMYEIARKDAYAPADLFRELKNVIVANPAGRFALEGLDQSPAWSGPGGTMADGISAFLHKLEGMKTTAFFSLELPLSQPLAPLKESLEQAAAGSFLLTPTSEERVKTFSVKKPAGAQGAPFQFRIEPGRGIVDAAKLKVSRIQFPRHGDL